VVTAPIPAAVPVEPPAAVVAFEAAPPLQPPPAPPLVEAPAPGVTRPQHRPAGAGKPKPRLDAGANIYDQMR
jgi:hypothetical protein